MGGPDEGNGPGGVAQTGTEAPDNVSEGDSPCTEARSDDAGILPTYEEKAVVVRRGAHWGGFEEDNAHNSKPCHRVVCQRAKSDDGMESDLEGDGVSGCTVDGENGC